VNSLSPRPPPPRFTGQNSDASARQQQVPTSACRAPAAMPGKRMRPLIKEEPSMDGLQEAQQQQAVERDGRRRRGEEARSWRCGC